MTIPIYADAADLAAWTGATAPSNATVLLRAASILVRDVTMSAMYAVDSSGLPTDPATLQAFADATCAHAAALAAAGIDPAAAGTQAGVSATAIGSASVSYLGYLGAEAARLELSRNLCPQALSLLRAQGMLSTPPMEYRG
jgi:hypothetical protein